MQPCRRILLALAVSFCLGQPALADGTPQLGSVVAIQEAEIQQLKADLAAARQAATDAAKAAAAAASAAASAAKAAQAAQSTANTAQSTANAAQSTAGQAASNAPYPIRRLWNQSGNYGSCNAACISQGLRCITGESGDDAHSTAVTCGTTTNVCLCAGF